MRATILLISFLCCISTHFHQVSANKVTASIRHVGIPALKPNDRWSHMTNGTYIYALCNDSHPDTSGSTSNCQIKIESIESSTSKSCNVTLHNATFSITRVSLLSPDKAILLWTTDKSPEYPHHARVVNVLDFKDDCKLYETRLRLPTRITTLTATAGFVPVVSYDDGTFDVFYENRDMCEAGSLCKVRFNDKAEKIGKEVPWVDIVRATYAMIYPVLPGSPAYGHLVLDYSSEFSQVSYVNVRGYNTPLRNYTYSRKSQDLTRPTFSTAHNLLTLCQNIPVTCEQLDLANNNTVLIPPYIINPELPITPSSINFPVLAVHSLQGGGFLHLQGTQLNRFDAKGEKAGAVEVEGLDCDGEEDVLITNVFEKDDRKYCVSSMCYDGRKVEGIRDVRFGIACFGDENFS